MKWTLPARAAAAVMTTVTTKSWSIVGSYKQVSLYYSTIKIRPCTS
jgi:hypothetical protein